MKTSYYSVTRGKCKNCGDDKPEYRIQIKGKSFIKSKFFKVFEEVNWMRGDDEYLGTFCKNCMKLKPWEKIIPLKTI